MMRRAAALLLLFFLCHGGAQAQEEDRNLIKNMLETFLGAGDLSNAALVAKKGALKYPQDGYWKERSGDVMSWLSKPEEALAYYKEALKTDKSPELVKKVRNLAVGLRDFETAAYVLELELRTGDTKGLNDLVFSYEQLGCPEKALDILLRYGPDEAAGLKIIELLTGLGRINEAGLKYLDLMTRYGDKPELLSGYFAVLVSQRRFNEAYAVLKAGKKRASEKDTAFWHDLCAAAYFSEDNGTALEAAGLLRKTGNANLQEYEILINSAKAENRALAEEYSLEAWRKFKKPYLFVQYLSLALQGGEYALAGARLRDLNRGDLDLFRETVSFWVISAAVKAALSDKKGAIADYRTGLKNNPSDENLKAQFVWFLLDAGLLAELRGNLNLISTPPPATDTLKLALAYACYSVNDSANSIKYLRALSAGTLNSRLLEADSLDLNGQREEAGQKRHAEFKKLRDGKELGEAQAESRARLCAIFCSAPEFKKELKAVKDKLSGAKIRDIELSRATLLNEAQRTVRLAGKMARKTWLEFYLAILTGDRPRQDTLLRKNFLELPLKDRIAALNSLGYRKRASQDIFDHLDKNPGDAALHLAAEQLFPGLSSELDLKSEFARRKTLEEISETVSYSRPLGNYSRLGLTGEYRKLSVRAGATLVLPKSEYKKAGVLFNTGRKFRLTVEAGLRSEQKDFFYAGLEYENELFAGTAMGIKAGFSGEAAESIYLMAGAVKDTFALSLARSGPGSITLKAEAAGDQFFSQDRNYLGAQKLLTFEASKNCAGYGWSLIPSAKLSFASVSSSLDGNYGILNRMIRLSDPKTLPSGYSQYGAGLTLKKNQGRLILRRLSPYLSASYYYNTAYNSGGALAGGIFTSVFKRDTLDVYLEYDKGLSGSSDEYRKAGMNWKLCF